MQSMLNLQATHGVPLSLFGIALTLHDSLPQEMADHDRRREIMRLRGHRSLPTQPLHANQEMGLLTNSVVKIKHGDLDYDANLLDLFQSLTAKAA